MGLDFPDHFSVTADAYARYRPLYPPELLARLAALAPAHRCCWDVATGSGQAALALAEHFGHVIATDASAQQIANAVAHPRVEYRVEGAERSSLAAASVDLITVACAVHWLALPAFYAEVRRVARPGAVLAAWSYSARFDLDPAIDPIVSDHIANVLGPYWTDAIHLVNSGYQDLEFPFTEITLPPATITLEWTVDQVVGAMSTWSASNIMRTATGEDPSVPLRARLAAAWGPNPTRTVRIPLFFRVGRVSPVAQ